MGEAALAGPWGAWSPSSRSDHIFILCLLQFSGVYFLRWSPVPFARAVRSLQGGSILLEFLSLSLLGAGPQGNVCKERWKLRLHTGCSPNPHALTHIHQTQTDTVALTTRIPKSLLQLPVNAQLVLTQPTPVPCFLASGLPKHLLPWLCHQDTNPLNASTWWQSQKTNPSPSPSPR